MRGRAGDAGEYLALRPGPVLGIPAMHVWVLITIDEVRPLLDALVQANRDQCLGGFGENVAEVVERSLVRLNERAVGESVARCSSRGPRRGAPKVPDTDMLEGNWHTIFTDE